MREQTQFEFKANVKAQSILDSLNGETEEGFNILQRALGYLQNPELRIRQAARLGKAVSEC